MRNMPYDKNNKKINVFDLFNFCGKFCKVDLKIKYLSLLQLFSEGTQNDDDDVLVALWFTMTRSPVVLHVA